ncbi:MAG: hypothetical protein JNM98_06110 [Rhodocyclaceae bacterium]|nr:hypothetical protein [Rhodocyclaceae bacterium]
MDDPTLSPAQLLAYADHLSACATRACESAQYAERGYADALARAARTEQAAEAIRRAVALLRS